MSAELPAIDLPNRRLGHIRGFDGLRGISLATVAIAHMTVILPVHALSIIPGVEGSLDMFFLVSGFLITALLLREQRGTGTVSVPAFFRRRALRLIAALYLMVTATALFAYLVHQWTPTEWPSIFSVLFYFSNYYSASNPSPFGAPRLTIGFQHLWSLSVEEQFYIVWPLVTIVLLTVRTRLRTVVIVLLSLIALIAINRFIQYQVTHAWWSIPFRTDTRADAILWGALLAHLWIRGREPRRGMVIAASLASVFLIWEYASKTQYSRFLYWGGEVAVDVAWAVILLAVLDRRWIGTRVLEFAPLVWLGTISYGLYLWHLPVYFAVAHFDQHWNDAVRVVVAVSVMLTLALLSWFFVERPLLRWGRRIEARRARGPDADPPPDRPVPSPDAPLPASAPALDADAR